MPSRIILETVKPLVQPQHRTLVTLGSLAHQTNPLLPQGLYFTLVTQTTCNGGASTVCGRSRNDYRTTYRYSPPRLLTSKSPRGVEALPLEEV
eukprot:323830-Pyramimonas_sp.AAC.2